MRVTISWRNYPNCPEATEYDKKLALEEKKPKSWCKSVSAFAKSFGGGLIFGISEDE